MRRVASPLGRVALCVFASGLCALVYQIVWIRHLRLIFGASTAASAAVLAIFMGGLGVGSIVLGRRADRHANPMLLYARLELGVAAAAAASPFLVQLAGAVYVSLGGTMTLGVLGGTLVRLGLATLVLGLPTFLMGGTLPAVARAGERANDQARRATGLLYAANSLGAVVGVFAATFFLLEIFGIRMTLWTAALVNLLIALSARALARSMAPTTTASVPQPAAPVRLRLISSSFVLTAAFICGWSFFAMELVWYRMLAPLLGGSAYTFGLILAGALLGIGVGSLLYASGRRTQRPSPSVFALTCALEAVLLAAPFAAGDGVAVAALALRSLDLFSFWGLVLSWALIVGFVVVPPAIVAGYQFPLLVGLLGRGRDGIGQQVGAAYLSNTAGAILGAIGAGFGLLPLLGAPGLWRLVVLLLGGLSFASLLWAVRRNEPRSRVPLPLAVGALGLCMLAAPGPTAFWRHSPIGAGRVHITSSDTTHLQNLVHERRRVVAWEADGIESGIAIENRAAHAFLINGKSDGEARGDAPTTVMSPLLGALLHPRPTRGLVIGLGTGTSAGWLAQVDGMEHVDVVELEPSVMRVAELCTPVNHAALENPRVNVIFGDGREFLQTTDRRYDVIMSEPSNPYRAGVASLFSQDFYRHAARRLTPDGVFVQWLQAYETDARTVRTVIATLASVLPSVEVWAVQSTDLALVARRTATPHDLPGIEARLATEPYRSALASAWGTTGLEGLYSGYLAAPGLATEILARDARWIDTDDRPVIEYGFSRTIGRSTRLEMADLHRVAGALGAGRPETTGGTLDWQRVMEARDARDVLFGSRHTGDFAFDDAGARARAAARHAYARSDLAGAREHWLAQEEAPVHPSDALLAAHAMVASGDAGADASIERVDAGDHTETLILQALWLAAQGRWAPAAEQLELGLTAARADGWVDLRLLTDALKLAVRIARHDAELGRPLYAALAEPFAVRMLDQMRLHTRLDLALAVDFPALCVEAYAAFEPHVPWKTSFLVNRNRCYALHGHPLARRAATELREALRATPPAFHTGLVPVRAAGAPPSRQRHESAGTSASAAPAIRLVDSSSPG